MAVVPSGTTLHDAKNILMKVFKARNPTTKGHEVAAIEWEGILVKNDLELKALQHREQVVVLIK